MENSIKFSILITTKNRLRDLIYTLKKIEYLISRNDVECIICDDGSADGTLAFLKIDYPDIQLIHNNKSQGLIFSRNKLLSLTTAEFAISLDDDAQFLSDNPLELIENYFNKNTNCGVIAFRIFWGLNNPKSYFSAEKSQRVQGFVGCAHVWRMSAWRKIPNYPAWFVFYGEEEFAAYHLFKKNIEIHYLPTILVQHRVEVNSRKQNADYTVRLRRSLRSGWYLYFMFIPVSKIPRKIAYSIWMQLTLKVFKGDFNAFKGLLFALLDLILAIPKIIKYSNRLTMNEFKEFNQLQNTKIYWKE
ncbi:MAG: glycosyltransferase [Flavobacterium sp.]|nr:glycosyltransferase [Flavobacterium sp.]